MGHGEVPWCLGASQHRGQRCSCRESEDGIALASPLQHRSSPACSLRSQAHPGGAGRAGLPEGCAPTRAPTRVPSIPMGSGGNQTQQAGAAAAKGESPRTEQGKFIPKGAGKAASDPVSSERVSGAEKRDGGMERAEDGERKDA